MSRSDLLFQIEAIINAKRIYRDSAANFVIRYPENFPFLIDLVFKNQQRTSIKAAWVLELICHDNLELMIPYIDYFIENLNKIKAESALRPIAKVCNFILNGEYYKPKSAKIITILSKNQKNKLVESNFDWLIESHKIASQVFAMDNLFVLSKSSKWVSSELKLVLQQNFINSSAGYQAHARKILNKI